MYKKDRLFAIPYSASIPANDYLDLVSNYKDNIENIYLSIPELEDHETLQKPNNIFHNEYTKNTYDFLTHSNNIYKRIVVYNGVFYNRDDELTFKHFDEVIYPIIEKYNIDGFVITSLPLAQKLHTDFPKLELQTSCNSFQWNIRQMNLWRELGGIEVFNPPREAGRTPSMLKEMHKEGFKLKVLVNEACIYGCPYTITHSCAVSNNTNVYADCSCGDYANALRSNFVHPKWLDDLDEYVYCFKLSGRKRDYNSLKRYFDAYIHQKEFTYINDIITRGRGNAISLLEEEGIKIPEFVIPDKLKYCEGKECNKTCFLCSEIMSLIHPM